MNFWKGGRIPCWAPTGQLLPLWSHSQAFVFRQPSQGGARMCTVRPTGTEDSRAGSLGKHLPPHIHRSRAQRGPSKQWGRGERPHPRTANHLPLGKGQPHLDEDHVVWTPASLCLLPGSGGSQPRSRVEKQNPGSAPDLLDQDPRFCIIQSEKRCSSLPLSPPLLQPHCPSPLAPSHLSLKCHYHGEAFRRCE